MNALVVGGSNGIGLSIVLCLLKDHNVNKIYVLDKTDFPFAYKSDKISYFKINLIESKCLDVLNTISNIKYLYITAGFGKLEYFQNFNTDYIQNIFQVNSIAPILLIKRYYSQLLNKEDFYCAVMVSIAGRLNSPLFSLYSATKAALSKFIEAVNIELETQGAKNRILEVSPGSLKNTSFTGGVSIPEENLSLAEIIIDKSILRETLFIPEYDEIYKEVIERYHNDSHQFGLESIEYKKHRLNK